ncbi:CGNR zinc finger domain-containing protein [Epibacterium ulvae]|uniref:CGNR zinc finger domain-containing protein n=1 Tax=Epibacterium ulvae TaxID=1156985 RepID=UPI001BFC7223|nr:CGNR zinc finger domain-containing protein [Epibacterium ulvae]MBT8152338.1 CGNR zinc finger domain-containing protein [Epibacterium ulvae]
MQSDRQIQLMFIGEAKSLDFLNSIMRPETGVVDWMETGTDVLRWFVLSDLATEDEVALVMRDTASLGRYMQEIREFREEFRSFVAEISEDPSRVAGHGMVARINGILGNTAQVLQIESAMDATNRPYQLTYHSQLRGPEDLLPRIAATCAQLICEADLRFVKNCEAEDCSLYFLDVSKSHRRRWCSMEVCGNRAKAAAYRKSKQRP